MWHWALLEKRNKQTQALLVCKEKLIYKLSMESLLSAEVKGYVNFGNIIRAAVPLGEVNLTHLWPPQCGSALEIMAEQSVCLSSVV